MAFTSIDYLILTIIFISTFLSFWRGAVREVLSLVTWVLALWLAFHYNPLVQAYFETMITNPQIRLIVSFISIMIVVLVLGTFVAIAFTKVVRSVGLSSLDRVLGITFGFARGVLMIAIAILLARFTELPNEKWWEESQLIPPIAQISDAMKTWLDEQGYDAFEEKPGI